MPKYNLENRLVNFSCTIIEISEKLKRTKAANHLSGQIIRSGTSTALNYGEAQSAESKKDFIHKFKIILKELREVNISLKIIIKSELCSDKDAINNSLVENNELISIFVKSIATAEKR